MHYSAITALAVLFAPPADAQSVLEQGFAGAIHGCEEWVLNPDSWINGPAPFISAVGLGDKMGLVAQVDEVSLPPVPLRRGNHYWRINSTDAAGYLLVVSDQMPMCHITGGGDVDLQPAVEAVLTSGEFSNRWEAVERSEVGDMASTVFRNRTDPSLSAVISRATAPGARLDRVQVLVTATYK
ncbi:hypothetical protein [Brevundimonas sp.]|uniref:hypothetical protein n=1 Tax=Brevundimonas sp. TaxID=1871086 RepID=UPI002EDA7835